MKKTELTAIHPYPYATSPLLDVQGLSVALGTGKRRLTVLERLDLTLDPGTFTVLIGPSGCGKSTLFNALTGLAPVAEGRILYAGQPVSHLKGLASYMQQKDLLLPWRTVAENAALGPELQGCPKSERRRRVMALMGEFGLDGFENRLPSELSGGMRQRAALLRTVLCRKNLLLLDEPFGALDAITRRSMQTWLQSVCLRFGLTVLLVTHDVDEALLLADTVHVLTRRPAVIGETLNIDLEKPRTGGHPGFWSYKERILAVLEKAAADR